MFARYLEITSKRVDIGLGLIGALMAMLALTVAPSPAAAEIHEVVVRNFEFAPASVAIAEGDTVRWVWESGIHTTTSGDPGACTPDGTWNAPVSVSSPSFERQFMNAGDFPYYCIPHCLAGMAGLVSVEPVVGIDDAGAAPSGAFVLKTNVPNPFTPRTSIRYELTGAGAIRLAVYDASGRLVSTLHDGPQAAGAHAVVWDGRDGRGQRAAAGVYFVRLEFDGALETQRVVLLQ